MGQAAPNHSPKFFADEGVLVPGMRALANLAVDYPERCGLGPRVGVQGFREPARLPASSRRFDHRHDLLERRCAAILVVPLHLPLEARSTAH